ncbi:hypothetical protein EN852_030900 [Mesorhizobium sp. M2E.F.Ca.ET.209.01.1.1]|uniref:hypothetical protein n=1 Tax=Mesorhizobium sp. M2E.F.Ca.ET.209.01.1.1 TaxID=2500526 RepID=UPI000FD84910|nr:hypothetical protein [Mesorhizobium sp. M2E.F.Ca.ET.209.01.1.1]TGS09478.1 hypothetical protein EN852_030900 [Mesorhizobium sp. M2E.F.Ca.ET.209.01.1.1]
MDVLEANLLAIEQAIALRFENIRMREQAWAYVEQSRVLAQQLAVIRSQPPATSPVKHARYT